MSMHVCVYVCVYNIWIRSENLENVVRVGSCLVPGFQGFRGFLAARYGTKAYVRYLICQISQHVLRQC